MIQTQSGSGSVMVQAPGLAPGVYYVEAKVLGGAGSATPYSLVVTVSGNVLDVQLGTQQGTESTGVITGAGTLTLPAAPTADVTVTLSSSDPSRLTFPATDIVVAAGQATATFDIEVVDNAVADGDLTVTVRGTAPGYNAGSATFLVIDDDGAGPAVSWSPGAMTETEARSPLVVLQVTLSEPAGEDVVVPFTLGGDATPGVDFDDGPLSSGTITLPAGTTDTSIFFSLVDDEEAEGDETLTISFGAPTGAVVGTPSTFTLTISDDEGPPMMDPDPVDPTPKGPPTMIRGGCACSDGRGAGDAPRRGRSSRCSCGP